MNPLLTQMLGESASVEIRARSGTVSRSQTMTLGFMCSSPPCRQPAADWLLIKLSGENLAPITLWALSRTYFFVVVAF
jgi:hypothetical protein